MGQRGITAPAFTTACKTIMSASRWRAWSLVQKFYKSVFSGLPCRLQLKINNFFLTSCLFQLFTLGRQSEFVANLCEETQIFTQTNSGWLGFYSEFLSNNLAGGVSGFMYHSLSSFEDTNNCSILVFLIISANCWPQNRSCVKEHNVIAL